MKTGKVKWYRFDGTGYVTDEAGASFYFDSSVLMGAVETGTAVVFRLQNVCGRTVAIDVTPISKHTS